MSRIDEYAVECELYITQLPLPGNRIDDLKLSRGIYLQFPSAMYSTLR